MIVVDRRSRGARWLEALDHAPDGAPARILAPLGRIYAALGRILRIVRGERALPEHPPSIAVGNLRAGGTGKTPVVEDLGRRLAARGHRVAVLARGYRAEGGGDEPGWLRASGLSVHLDPDRRRAFDAARAGAATVVLLDDGLQTRARAGRRLAIVLDRDLERTPRTLPAGPAREGPSALDRADGILVRRESPNETVIPSTWHGRPCVGFRLAADRWIDGTGTEHPVDAPPFEGPVVGVSGLARPASFESTLADAGVPIAGAWRFDDHWHPGRAEIEEVVAWARARGAATLVCPEKNRERLLARAPGLSVVALAGTIRWDVHDPLEALALGDVGRRDEGDGTDVPSPRTRPDV